MNNNSMLQRFYAFFTYTFITVFLFFALPNIAFAAPTLSKVFTPNTIGSGSVSTTTFTITNNDASPATTLAFTDTLPAAITLADPANASTDCNLGISGSLTAPDGGSTITLSDAQIGASSSCTITVDVTASTPGVHTNPAVTLNSSAGSSMSLAVDFTVDNALPGFSKSFSPSSIPLGNKSTLTFTINNSAEVGNILNLDFTDNLPTSMVIADPANASTTCGTATIPPMLTATANTSVIILDANGTDAFPAIAAGTTCTVIVDVISTGVGVLNNVSGELLADFTSAGKASASLEVTVTPLAIQKSFTNDPVPPGGSVTLDFIIDNFDRVDSATGVAFTDDLTTLVPALAGLTFDSLVSNDCGGSVSGVGGTTIGLSGSTIAPESSCTIRVSLSVPAGAAPGAYTNTTSTVSGTVDGSPVVGNMATDDLFVAPVPILTKEFLEVGTLAPDPVVNAGDDVVLRFTLTNTSTTSGATDVAFLDELTDGGSGTGFLPFPVTVTLPPVPDPPCGAGSSLALVSVDTDRQALQLAGGSLAAAPGAGATCTFDVTLTIPVDLSPGTYLNTTEEPSATVDGATRTGEPASDSLTVIAAPQLTKSFTNDPVAPGGTVTLEFTLNYPADASGDATGIMFTDNLVPILAGLTANLPPTPNPPCGAGSSLTGSAGDTLLTLMGGTLSPGESCSFSVTLDVPAGAAPGSYTNTTSGVSATVDGLAATSVPASDNLKVAGLAFSKEFLGDPAIPGDTVTLRFTIDNLHPTDDATITFFTDNLNTVIPGLAATGGPSVNECGGTLSGTTFLTYTGGSVLSGASCNIEVEVLVPLGAADGTYLNTTSSLSATQGGTVTIDPAIDNLTVNSNLLQLTKSFTDDPVSPGNTVTLEFTLTNLDALQAATSIDFSDDLSAVLPGVTFDSEDFNGCGATVGGLGTNTLTVTGASLGAGGTCTLRFTLTVPSGTAANIYTNTTSAVTGTIGGFTVSGDPASDDLEVTQLLMFSKSFNGPTTATGNATVTFKITNPGTNTASGISFTDDLNAVIPGLIATSLPAVPCGAGSSITGIGFLNMSGGELPPAGGTCSFNVDVLVPASATAGTFPNTTSDLFQSGLPVADPATADLTIEPPPTFAKVFAPDSIVAGAVSTLTFTIDNSASALAASNFSFTDNLPSGVEIADPTSASTTCSGMGDASPGATSFSFAGGSVPAGSDCTVSFKVTSSTPGSHVNTTGNMTSSSGNSGTATDTLTVTPPPTPVFTKVFAADSIVAGAVSTLTFTINNSASLVTASSLSFSDIFPAGVVIANPTNASTTCGGMGDASPGVTSFSFAGGSVAAGATCTISFNVTSSTPGSHVNITGDLTSSSGNSGTATDTLTVTPPPAPVFSKVFASDNIIAGAVSTLTFTINNSASLVPASSLTFTDNLPAGLVIAAAPNASTNCTGGTLTAAADAAVITYSGGTVAASSACTVQVDVTGAAAGVFVNTSGALSSSSGISGSATATLTINPLPVFNKAFTPGTIPAGGTSTLEFTVNNSASTLAASALAFTDTLPGDLVIAAASSNGCGGTLTATAGSNTITYSGGTVAANASCTVQVDVTAPSVGTFVNTSGALSSSLGTSGTASATLTVGPLPVFSKAFTPGTIPAGGTSTLEFTVNNSASTLAASALAFTDTLPGDLVIAAIPNVVTGCGGTLTDTAGSNTITYSGGTVAANTSCTVQVDVTAPSVGTFVNTSGTLSSSLGTSGTASASLTVGPLPVFSKAFTPGTIPAGGTSTLEFTVNNSASTLAASSLAFNDTLPGDLVIAAASSNGCGGTLTAIAGSNTITYSGGTVAANASCIVQVDVTAPSVGTFVNTSGTLSSSLGTSGTASASLTVGPLPVFSKAFTPGTIPAGSTSTLEFTVNNSASTLAASSLAFTDNLPSAVTIANPPNISDTCGGLVTAAPGTSSITFTGGTVSASSNCTINVDVTSRTIGSHINTTEALTSFLGTSGVATDTLTVTAPLVRSFTGTLPSGLPGTILFTTTDPTCTFWGDPQFIDVDTFTPAPPANLEFVDGLISFMIDNCAPGATVNITVDYGQVVDPTAENWKFGTLAGVLQWFVLPSTISGNTMSFSITDNGLGDEDDTPGKISDPFGAAFARAAPIPAISPLGLVLLAILLMLSGHVARKRKWI